MRKLVAKYTCHVQQVLLERSLAGLCESLCSLYMLYHVHMYIHYSKQLVAMNCPFDTNTELAYEKSYFNLIFSLVF